jgi:ribonuclease P protein component
MSKFKKSERLCSKKMIEKLANSGRSFFYYPFKVVWLTKPLSENLPAKVIFAVSKKKIKKAVERNRIKRITREAYRLNKNEYLYKDLREKKQQCFLMLIYVGKELPLFCKLEKKIIHIFERLLSEIENSPKGLNNETDNT